MIMQDIYNTMEKYKAENQRELLIDCVRECLKDSDSITVEQQVDNYLLNKTKMKTITTILLLFVTMLSYSQSQYLTVSQDTRLATIGDDKGNEAFTANFNIGLELRIRNPKNRSHYFFMRPEYEYADLKGGAFNRYSASMGITFFQWVDNFDFTASIGGGLIWRNGLSGFHGVGNLQLTYYITDGIGIFIDSEFLQRSDLNYSIIRYSGKVGVKLNMDKVLFFTK